MRQLCLFYKVFHSKVPKYIHSLIPSMRTSARQPNTFTSFYCRTEYFQNSFLPCFVKEWNKHVGSMLALKGAGQVIQEEAQDGGCKQYYS